jgi:hypothetical protein
MVLKWWLFLKKMEKERPRAELVLLQKLPGSKVTFPAHTEDAGMLVPQDTCRQRNKVSFGKSIKRRSKYYL